MKSEKMRELEGRGETVEEAIKNGLTQLGLNRDEVEIEVLDEGSRGLLGLGAREAVVKLKPRPSATKVETAEPEVPRPAAPVEPTPPKKETKPTAVSPAPPEETLEADQAEAQAALETIQTLLAKMQVTATVTASVSEPDDVTGRRINVINIHGEDLGVLIGPRGDTLNAMQYLARLIVGHDLHQRITFVVDVEGYRQRRELALSRLAERMAGKVVKRQSPVSLEPMPPHERRIIHMTLREREDVYTESSGEGKHRKVKIYPKR